MTSQEQRSRPTPEDGWRELRLEVRVDNDDGYEQPQLIPRVDGSVLFLDLDTRAESDSSGLGMDPEALLTRNSPLLPPELTSDPTEEPRMATVWRCSCGESGDASIGVRVRRETDSFSGYDAVVWDDWRIRFGRDRPAPPTLRFDARAYYSEFIRAYTDRWWDNVTRRAARELAGILDTRPEILGTWGCALIWTRGYVHNGQGHVGVYLRSGTTRHSLDIPCDPTADSSAEARRIADLLAGNDPTTLPARFHSTMP